MKKVSKAILTLAVAFVVFCGFIAFSKPADTMAATKDVTKNFRKYEKLKDMIEDITMPLGYLSWDLGKDATLTLKRGVAEDRVRFLDEFSSNLNLKNVSKDLFGYKTTGFTYPRHKDWNTKTPNLALEKVTKLAKNRWKVKLTLYVNSVSGGIERQTKVATISMNIKSNAKSTYKYVITKLSIKVLQNVNDV